MPLLLIAIVVVTVLIFKTIFENFINVHSAAIKELREINQTLNFHDIP